jgi:hypothetical protein
VYFFTEDSFFGVFDFPWLAGDSAAALKDRIPGFITAWYENQVV